MSAPNLDPPPEINPYESPKSEPRPERPPTPEVTFPQASIWPLVKCMSPVWFPGIFYYLAWRMGLPEEVLLSWNLGDNFYTFFIGSVPLVLAIAFAIVGLCGWCTMRWLRDRNARLTGACAIFFGICSIPAAILITAVIFQAGS